MRLATCWAIGVLLPLAAACGDDGDGGDISGLLAASERVSELICACDGESDCGLDGEERACVEGVVKRHAGELGSWVSCALGVYNDLEPCIMNAGCADDAIETCFETFETDARCGEIPPAIDEAIEDEIDRDCPMDLDCLDGSSARGAYCNDVPDCADASDEDFCEEFTCLNGDEVSESWVCDGFDDCGDNSDEDPAQCGNSSGG